MRPCAKTLVGLDVTHRTWATRDDMALVAAAAQTWRVFARHYRFFYIDFYVKVRQEQGCFLHDPLAVMCATNPELFDYEQSPITMTLAGEERAKAP